MIEEKTEGVVLEALPYEENHHIVTLFTLERGMIKLFVRGSKKRLSHAIVTPLTRLECLYGGKSDQSLLRFRDASIIDQYLPLRSEYRFLQEGCFLAHSILKSQLLWKPAPALYQLLTTYLTQVPNSDNSPAFRGSFLLKLLRHEGLFGVSATCATCSTPLIGAALLPGETVCLSHAPPWAVHLSEEELLTVCNLVSLRSMREILATEVSDPLWGKLQLIFEQLTEQT